MKRSVLLVGSSVCEQEDLFLFLEEFGLDPVRAESVEQLKGISKTALCGILFEDIAHLALLHQHFGEIPLIVLAPEGMDLSFEWAGVSGIVQQPIRWSELLLALQQILPMDGTMQSEIQIGDWIDFSLSSNRGIFQGIRILIRSLVVHSPLPKDQVYHISHAICEILINAMEHGNRFDPRKRVKGSFVLFQDRLIVKIEDQGCGFFPEQIPNPLDQPAEVAEMRKRQGKRPGGYGLAFANRWMTLDYSNRGNAVLLTKIF